MDTRRPTEELTEYMNRQIRTLVRQAVQSAWRQPRETSFLFRTVWAQNRAAHRRLASEKRGIHIPPFLIASITSRCNLFCKGCYARANQICGEDRPDGRMMPGRWGELFREGEQLGISFILLAGGEPLLNRPVIEAAAQCRRIVFPIFTNGILLDDEYAGYFDQNRNLLPVLSLEGNETDTDDRRGAGTHAMIEAAMVRLKDRSIFYGASVTVTRENLATVSSDEFCGTLVKKGCKLLFFVEYVPVTDGEDASAPGEAERNILEQRMSALRSRFPGLLLIAFPGDEKYMGGCVAAGRGFFHINSDGGAEPCPFSPFSDTSVLTGSLKEALASPLFRRLAEAGLLLGEHKGGCQLFEHENEVKGLLKT